MCKPGGVTAGRLALALYGSLAVWKLLALVLVVGGIGLVPEDFGQCVFQVLALIALLNVPQIAVGLPVATSALM